MKLTLVVDEVSVEAHSAAESELLQWLLKAGTQQHVLNKFPGGAALLRGVLAQLPELPEDAADGAVDFTAKASLPKLTEPALSATSLGDYLEAAVILGSGKLIRLLPQGQELRSRQALPLLEQVVRLSDGKDVSEDVDQALELVAGHFCDCLDFRDFRLGDSLAAGSTRVSLQVLRQHRKKSEAPSPGHDASRPGTVTPSLSGYSAQVADRAAPGMEWSPHKFAVHVLQRQIAFASEEAARTGRTRGPSSKPSPDLLGLESEDEAEDVAVDAMEDRLSDLGALVSMDTVEDISEELTDSVPDELLRKLAGLAEFFDTATTPPITGAVAVRSLLLTDKADFTRQLFRDLFHRDKKLQWMVVCGEVPAEFLREVSWHPQSSLALRRMLAGYASAEPLYIADLIEDLLFGELLDEPHSEQLILRHPLTEKLILWLLHDAAEGVDATDADRLRKVGRRLFQVSFVPQNGFLPKEESDECPWDTGLLDAPLLSEAPMTEDSLSLARTVLLRRVLSLRRAEACFDDEDYQGFVPEIARLWPLGRWKQCRDPVQIGEALGFLSNCWKALASLPSFGDLCGSWPLRKAAVNREALLFVGAGSRRRGEEQLLQMFSDLEVWRLPQKALLNPWVPGQVLAAHVTAHCKELEDRQLSLVDEARENLEEINRLNTVVAQLKSRLEATDMRSTQCMQKQAEVNNILRHLPQ